MNFPDPTFKPLHGSSDASADLSNSDDTGEPLTVPDDLRDIAAWTDDGLGMPEPPSAAFATNVISPAGDLMTTIGHVGRYALKSRIGEGGLGTVYAAHDPLLSRLIAIKTLSLNIPPEQRDAFNSLFFNEARAAAGLSHPHIVTVFDAGISDDNAYIAMELLSGLDLRQLRSEGWRANANQAALIVRRVADALAYAHGKGVIHRDVKPANIFMVGRTQPRVLDFGIARMAHLHDTPNEDEVAGGSPYYMAPEQIRRQTVDKRADVFSLGVVLYELLTDEKPFRGRTLEEITQAVISHAPPLAHTLKPTVPVVLSEIAAKAMQKDPDKRHRSARALSRELRQWLEENNAPSDDPELTPRKPKPVQKQLARWVLPAAAGVLATALMGSAVWWGLASSRMPSLQMATTDAPVLGAPALAAQAQAQAQAQAAAEAASDVAPDAQRVMPPAPSASTALNEIATGDVMKSVTVRVAGGAGVAAVAGNVAAANKVVVSAAPNPALAALPAPQTTQTAKAPQAAQPSQTANDSPRDKRAREAKERAAKTLTSAPTRTASPAAGAAPGLATGVLRLAVSPWGQVEVDGKAVGTTPPLNELTLSEGKHQVTLRNDDFPPHSVTVTVTSGQPVSVKHKFGS